MATLPFSELALKYAPWAISKADMAKQCGLRFYWKYVEKKKEPESERSEGRIGTAVHKVIELVLKGEKMERAFRVAAVDSKLTTNEIDDLFTFQGTITSFLERIAKFKIQRDAKQEFVEHKFGITIDLKPSTFFGKDVFFRGAWDLAYMLGNRDLVMLDHKSGTPADNMDRYTNQLNSYALAGRVLVPEIKGAVSAIHYVQDGSIKWGTYISVEQIDEKLINWFVTYLNDCVANLEKIEAQVGWQCGFCGYASKCEAYQKSKKG